MSSGRPSEILASSTFRRALAGALLVWGIVGGGLVWLSWQTSRFVLEEIGGEIETEIGERLEEIAEERRFFEEEFFDEALDLEIEWDLSPTEFLAEYTAFLWELIEEEDPDEVEELAFRIRLAVLGEHGEEVLEEPTVPAYLDLMFEEIPERYHDLVDALVEAREHLWTDRFEEESDELSAGDVREALEEAAAEPLYCVSLRTVQGEMLVNNAEELTEPVAAGDGVERFLAAVPAELQEEFEVEERWCLVREVRLVDGSQVRFGRDITESWEWLGQLTKLRAAALAAGLLIALAMSWWLARSAVRHLADVRRVGERLAVGDFRVRLPRRGAGDFDRAAGSINAMVERLERSVESLSQVTDNIAHDLRTPLTRLQGQLDLLKRDSGRPDGAPTEAMVEAVQEEADQLLSTFNALLRIAQVESGSRRRGFRTFDLDQVVADVGELYAPAFADQELDFDVSTPGSELSLHGDIDLWMQALSNLLDNALKYTPKGGRVRLALDRSAVGARITLRDSGPGIPESEAENVFQRFYRLQRHRGDRGNGLGLSLVKAICDLHEATIDLANEGGLVIRIQLPS